MSDATLDSFADAPKRSTAPTPEHASAPRPPKKKRGPAAKLFRALLRLILFIVLLLGLAFALLYFLTVTDKGFGIAVSQATQRVKGLEITNASGNMSDGIEASALTFKNDSMDLSISGLDSAWQSSCLTRKKFCLERLIVDQLRVEMLGSTEPSTESPRTDDIVLPSIPLPLDLNLDDIQVKEFIFKPAGDAPEQVVKDVRLQAHNVGNRLTITQLSAAYLNFSTDISGEITLEDDYPLDLNIVAYGTDVIEENDFQINLNASNSVKDLVFEAAVSGAVDVTLSGTAKPLDPELPLTLAVNADQVGWPLDTLKLAKAEQLALNIDGDLDKLNISFASDVSAENVPQTSIAVNALASNSFEDVVFDGTVSGTAEVTLTGSVKPLDPKLPLTLTVNSDQIGWPLDTMQLAKAKQLAVNINGNMDDFAVSFATDVSGKNVPETSIDITAIANPHRVDVPAITIQTLGGSVTGNAAATLDEEIVWNTDLVIKDINPAGVAPDINGKLSGKIAANGGVLDGRWKLDLTQSVISGTLRDFPFDLEALLSKSYDEQWNVEKVVLNNGKNQVNASGTASDTLNFAANLKLEQLQNFLPGLAGGFNADLNISGKPTQPSVKLRADSAVVKFNDLLITGLKLDADVARGAKEASALSLTVDKIQQGEQLVQNTKVELDGTLPNHTLKVFADGPQATAVDISAEGGLSQTFNWAGKLQAAELDLPAHEVTLADPFDLGWNNEIKKATIGAHCWRTETTRLCLENDVLAEPTGTADVTLTQYPLARLNPFLPADSELQGVLKADANINWGEQYPGGFDATLKSQIDDGGIKVQDASFDELSFAYDLFTVDANATGEKISADVALKSKGLGDAAVDFTMDPSQERKPISGDLSLQGFDISFLQAFLPDFDEISGVINANGKISGSLTDPNFNGQVELDKPIANAETLPLSVDGGKLTVDVNGKRADISGALQSGDGTMGITGNADWTNIAAWNANINIKGEELNVQSPPLEESSVDTDMQITLRPGSVRVRGDVNVPRADIEVATVPEGASSLSDDIVIIEDEAEEASEQAAQDQQTATASATDLDVRLNVSLGDDVQLNAYGLEASLTGDMSVGLRPPRPVQLGGEIRIVEGIFKSYGQDLTVTDGQILFVGPIEQTQLNMDAVRTISSEDRTAGLRVGGRVAEPSITLFTEPADKSQDAILSYILLGRDINEASGAEQNFLASAALALTLKGSKGTVSNLAGKMGVKDFSLGSQGSGENTEVVVSGRLNDRLLLRYGQNVFASNAGTLFLRYDLTKKLYLEATEGAERAVDLFYSFSF